jgi:hypothetical protein
MINHLRRPSLFFAIVAMALLAVWSWSATGRPAGARLVGTWRLVSIEERDAEGKLVVPMDYGTEPIGLLMYDTTGHMSAQAMRRGRARLPSDDVHLAPPELAKAAFVGYNGYFGRYEVREQEGLVIHHVEGSMIPNWEGGQQFRKFTLTGDRLVLEPPAIQAAGQKRVRRLTWERVK